MLRVVSELKPTWVIGENVAGFTSMVQFTEDLKMDEEGNAIGEVGDLLNRTGRFVADEVLESLEKIGYEVQSFNIPACGVKAPHERKRVFIIAHSNHSGLERWDGKIMPKCSGELSVRQSCAYVSNAKRKHDDDARYGTSKICREQSGQTEISKYGWWDLEPNVGRVANGVQSRVDRLKCLGNAVVPQQVYPILQAIADIERSTTQ